MTTFTARTPVDLLALVPIVIGFHPSDSVVVLTLGPTPSTRFAPRPPRFHARVDLPRTADERQEVARMLRSVIEHHDVGLVGLVLYTDDALAAGSFAETILSGLDDDGVEVLDVIRVEGDRFYAVEEPEDPGIPYDLSAHPFTARGVLEGRVVHESRSALRETLLGTDPDDIERVAAAATTVVDALSGIGIAGDSLASELVCQARWLEQRVGNYLLDPATIGVEDAARLLVLVSFEALREVAWASMCRQSAPLHVELWRGLLCRAPADLRAGAGGLLAFAAWLAGDGALAWCAIDRCLESDAEDQLSQHVAQLVASATPPSVWTPIPVESLRLFARSDSSVS